MKPTFREVLDAAQELSCEEQLEVAESLLACLGKSDGTESAYLALRAAVDEGIADLDAGRSRQLSVDEIGDYLRERARI